MEQTFTFTGKELAQILSDQRFCYSCSTCRAHSINWCGVKKLQISPIAFGKNYPLLEGLVKDSDPNHERIKEKYKVSYSDISFPQCCHYIDQECEELMRTDDTLYSITYSYS